MTILVASCERADVSSDTDSGIVELDAVTLRTELAAGRLSALEVTEAFLRRIAAVDDGGPELNAVIALNPEAQAIALKLDEQRARGEPLGTLHGIPVLLKANIDTADALATSAGSLALAEHFAMTDAAIVQRLRDAGAVVLGKTNLSEWANFRSMASTSGWSSVGGQTRNPYVLNRNPCGSSSGSAVAVAARLAPLAVGTETDGSIVCPAGINGVVGVKPTAGTVSQHGIIPIAASQDTAGPLARTVADAELLLGVLVDTELPADTTRTGLAGLRIGIVRDYHGAGQDPAVEAGLTTALAWLASAGATLVDPVAAALAPEVERAEMTILLAEFHAQLPAYLAPNVVGPHTLGDLIAFNEANTARVMPYFGQELLLAARDAPTTTSSAYRDAIATAATARQRLGQLFADHTLDALVAPANGPAWRTNYAAGDQVGVGSSNVAAVTGYPSVAVPTVLAGELPLGLALIGRPREEALLLAIAAALERARGPFPAPRFLATAADPSR